MNHANPPLGILKTPSSSTICQSSARLPEQSISDDDPPIDVNQSIVIPEAPRRLWVQVNGLDDDMGITQAFILPPPGLFLIGDYPTFDREGTVGSSNAGYDFSGVTRVFDIADITALTTFPIELATGDFRLAFTVFGRIRVDAFVPAKVTIRDLSQQPPFLTKPIFDLREVAAVALVPGSGGNHSHLVGLGADEAIYHKVLAFDRPSPRNEGWRRVQGEVKPPVKVLASAGGGFSLLAYDSEGGVLCGHVDRFGQEPRWWKLGGRFQGPLAAAEGRNGQLELFGLGEDGVVYHASLRPDEETAGPGDWQRIGDGVAGSLSAVAMPDGAVGVFALGRDGRVLHRMRRHEPWTADAPAEWQTLGHVTDGHLSVVRPVEEKGVALIAVADDGGLRYLVWPDYPHGEPPRRWTDGGTIDQWLDSQPRAP